MRAADATKDLLHYVSQDGQPYGSTRRCCEVCGAMCWPGVEGSAQLWTDDFDIWKAADDNCDGSRRS